MFIQIRDIRITESENGRTYFDAKIEVEGKLAGITTNKPNGIITYKALDGQALRLKAAADWYNERLYYQRHPQPDPNTKKENNLQRYISDSVKSHQRKQ